MGAEQSAALVRRYFEECVSRASGPDQAAALALLDELLTDDFVMFYNNDTDAQAARGRNQHKKFLATHARSLPDDHWAIVALVAQGDSVACQWRFAGTYAKTGNRVAVLAADFFRIRDGRLAELRRFLDFKDFEAQLER